MSQPLPIVTITGASIAPVSVGPSNAYSAVVIFNESMYTIMVQAGSSAKYIPAWTGDVLGLSESSWGGTLNFTLTNISTSSASPSASLLITAYGINEPVTGTYPVALSRLTNIGNGVLPTSNANAVIVSGETAPNDLVKSSPLGYGAATVDLKDDGTLTISPNANGVQTPALQIIPGGASSTTLIQLDNGKIATDGAGGFFCYSIQGKNGALPISAQLSGAANGLYFQRYNGVAVTVPFSIGGQYGGAQSWIDNSGLNLGSGAQGYGLVSSDQSGSANGLVFRTWSGSAAVVPFSVGGQYLGAKAWVDNSGNIAASGTVTGAGFYGTSGNLFIRPVASAGAITVLTAWNTGAGGFWANCVLTNADGGISLGAGYIQSGAAYLGFKSSTGTKLAEFKSSGQLVVTAGNPSFVTTAATAGFATGGVFDSFDVAEAYETDAEYQRGAVLCPGPGGRLTRCMHNGCHAAFVVSTGGAVNIGGQFSDAADYDPRVVPMALVGRVLVDTDEPIDAFGLNGQPTLVTTNGRGGVRAMRPGETGYALGYALTDAREHKVGIVVRPMYCQAPGPALAA